MPREARHEVPGVLHHTIVRSMCQALLERSLECVEKGDPPPYLPSNLWPRGCVSYEIDQNLKFLDKIRKQSQFFNLLPSTYSAKVLDINVKGNEKEFPDIRIQEGETVSIDAAF